ncbi:uncharacterized protein LOC110850145 isoform X1 [Folsomia candida]|nr:uncharacterized protein LOC110850145 isoform X1 [Folsomia candida]
MANGELLVRMTSIDEFWDEIVTRTSGKLPYSSNGDSVSRVIGNDPWLRFATLYSGNGQKYTIGQKFESRETQGEFLFCFGPGVSKGSHCEIVCYEGSFYIQNAKPLFAEICETFINGVKLVGRQELHFGDMISLGNQFSDQCRRINDLHEYKNSARVVFWFMKVQTCSAYTRLPIQGWYWDWKRYTTYEKTRSDWLKGDQHEESIVNNKSDIMNIKKLRSYPSIRGEEARWDRIDTLALSTILNNLKSPRDLGNCRLVCSTWKQEATKRLNKLATVNFSLSDNYPSLRNRLSNFMQEGVTLSPKTINFSCSLCHCGEDLVHTKKLAESWQCSPDAKFYSDMEAFLRGGFVTSGSKVRLRVANDITCEQGWGRLENLLKLAHLSLEQLDLCIDEDLIVIKRVELPGTVKMFPSLKTFDLKLLHKMSLIQMHQNFYPIKESVMTEWVKFFVSRAPYLESLTLDPSDSTSSMCSSLFLREIVAGGFKHLKSLSLYRYSHYELNTLLKLDRKLETLVLSDYLEEDDLDWGMDPSASHSLMTDVLETFAPNLKYLELGLPCGRHGAVRMPTFPELRVFKINDDSEPNIEFSPGGINYAKHFPKLKELEIFLGFLDSGESGFLSYLKIFVPEDPSQICRTVTRLKFPFLDNISKIGAANERARKWWYELDLHSRRDMDDGKIVGQIAKLFPNARNNYLVKVRSQEKEDLLYEESCKFGTLTPWAVRCNKPIFVSRPRKIFIENEP